MATSTHQPAHVIRCGSLTAAIWHNVGEYGPYFTVTYSRSVRDQEGTWRNLTSFTLRDLDTVAFLNAQTKEWIAGQVQKPA